MPISPPRYKVSNQSGKAIEFESKALRQEQVIAAGKSVSLKIKALKLGKYKFFDEYNEAAKGEIVAK